MATLELREEQQPGYRSFWIDVPYEERAEVRALGAHWDGKVRRWWASGNEEAFERFEKWLPSELFDFGLASPEQLAIDLIGLPWDCIRCGALATVLVGMVKCGKRVSSSSLVRCDTELVLRLADRMLPDDVRREWRIGQIRRRYSKTIRAAYLSNGCPECSLIFGNFPVYNEQLPYVLATAGERGVARLATVDIPESWWTTTLSDRFDY